MSRRPAEDRAQRGSADDAAHGRLAAGARQARGSSTHRLADAARQPVPSVLWIGPLADETLMGCAGSLAIRRTDPAQLSADSAIAADVDVVVIDDGIGWSRVYAHLEELSRRRPPPVPLIACNAAPGEVVVGAAERGARRAVRKPLSTHALIRAIDDCVLLSDRTEVRVRLRQRLRELRLTARERDLAIAVVRGLSNEEIAAETGSCLASVKNELHALYYHFGIRSRAELFHLLLWL